MIVITFILTMISNDLNAQWTHYDTGNTILPGNDIKAIAFEGDSISWIGTDFGLVKIKGTVWTVYNTLNSGLPDNSIRCITVDTNNVKWIGTFLGGFTIFNDTTWLSFNSTNSPLPDDHVKDIQIQNNGTKWLATTGGLVSIDTANVWKIYSQFTSPLQSNNIARIYIVDSTSLKIVGTVNGGLSLLDSAGNIVTYTIANSGIADNSLYDIDVDLAGNYWMASPANGLVVKVQGFGWTNFSQSNSGIYSSSLTCLEFDDQARLWIGSIDSGLIMKNGLTFKAWNTNNSPLQDNYIECLQFAQDGKLWIGTQTNGLYIVDIGLLTGIEDHTAELQWEIFPNPVDDELVLYHSVKYEKEKLAIYDVTGKNVHQVNVNSSLTRINTANFAPGIYIVQLSFGENAYYKKIVKY